MNTPILLVLLLVTALGTGLAGGGFLVFSTFVLQGLDGLPAAGAVAAMQRINRRAVTPLFMTTVFGTALACLAVGVLCVVGSLPALAAAGAAAYLLGAVGTTVAGNVPLNQRLDGLDPTAATPADWTRFRSRWLALNHVRTLSSALACGILLITLGA